MLGTDKNIFIGIFVSKIREGAHNRIAKVNEYIIFCFERQLQCSGSHLARNTAQRQSKQARENKLLNHGVKFYVIYSIKRFVI
jgi:hypothetical protein